MVVAPQGRTFRLYVLPNYFNIGHNFNLNFKIKNNDMIKTPGQLVAEVQSLGLTTKLRRAESTTLILCEEHCTSEKAIF